MSKVNVTNDYRSKFADLMPMNNDDEHEFTPKTFLDVELDENEEGEYPIFTVRQFNNQQSMRFKKQVDKDQDKALMEMRRLSILQGSITDTSLTIPTKSPVVDNKEIVINLIKDVFVGWSGIWNPKTQEEIPYEDYTSLYMMSEDILQDIIFEIAIISGDAKRPKPIEDVEDVKGK